MTRQLRTFPADRPMPGTFGSVVGLVSYGTIAQLVRARLRGCDVKVSVFDPYMSEDESRREGVKKVELDELFATSDAVSVHTPHLPETVGLIQDRHLRRLRPGAFFLNTARGEVIDEPALIRVLQQRPDVTAMLDVTTPEPPESDSPLYTLPNVVLTPHLAGSVGRECLRMGAAMVDEYERFKAGQPLLREITAEKAALIA